MKEHEVVRGRRAVLEVLRVGRRRVRKVLVLDSARGGIVGRIADKARRRGAEVRAVPERELAEFAGGKSHQGVVALVETLQGFSLDDLLSRVAGGAAFLVALDELKDPQNVGAIVRTAEAAGAHGVVMTLNRSAAIGRGAHRASAGAVEHLPAARVVNLRDALERLKEAGCWVVGADAGAEKEYTQADFRRPTVLVLGEEGKGLRSLTRRTCDELVRIPLGGKVESLNVSAAAAVLCFEVVRQRQQP